MHTIFSGKLIFEFFIVFVFLRFYANENRFLSLKGDFLVKDELWGTDESLLQEYGIFFEIKFFEKNKLGFEIISGNKSFSYWKVPPSEIFWCNGIRKNVQKTIAVQKHFSLEYNTSVELWNFALQQSTLTNWSDGRINFPNGHSSLAITLGYKNHKSCKILLKFSSTLHFLQESYKFVQESQTLQICYNVEHFLQDSDNIFAKNAFFW